VLWVWLRTLAVLVFLSAFLVDVGAAGFAAAGLVLWVGAREIEAMGLRHRGRHRAR
jgi:hypothetical protein